VSAVAASAPAPAPARTRRTLLWILAAVVAINLLLAGIDSLLGGPSGPPASSYATSPRGLAAWAELLERRGQRAEPVLEQADRVDLDPAATVVLLEPDTLVPGEASALRDFAERGGLLVAGGREPEAWLLQLLDAAPPWTEGGPRAWRSVDPDETGGARRVLSTGDGAWLPDPGWTPLVTEGGSRDGLALVVRRPLGSGEVVLVADPAPLENRLLGEADDAALALALTGGRERVLFLEAVHGYGRGRGLGALPERWRIALAGLALAALLWLLSRARRLGPPDPEPPEPPPARRAHVDALAAALARTRDRDWAAERLRRHAATERAARR
jgi:hypothetical protein